MKTIKDENNMLLPRREMLIEISHPDKPTPKKGYILDEFSNFLKCDKDLVMIKSLKTKYGSTTSHAEIYIYDKKEDMKIIERIKEDPKKDKPAEEKPAEEKPAEEKPAEEKPTELKTKEN